MEVAVPVVSLRKIMACFPCGWLAGTVNVPLAVPLPSARIVPDTVPATEGDTGLVIKGCDPLTPSPSQKIRRLSSSALSPLASNETSMIRAYFFISSSVFFPPEVTIEPLPTAPQPPLLLYGVEGRP